MDAVEKMLNGDLGISRIVSLGPGDSKSDSSIINYLYSISKNKITYIPVDISEYMVLNSIRCISEMHAAANVPFGVLGDFESDLQSIRELLGANEQEGKTLFVMLGNTISNLDKGPESFYKQVHLFMQPGDYFLFDILLGNYDQRLNGSIDKQCDANSIFPCDDVWDVYKKFIAQGARRISGDHSVYKDVLNEFSDNVVVTRRKYDFDDSDELCMQYKKDGVRKVPIFYWRKYDKNGEKFEARLKQKLNPTGRNGVIATDCIPDPVGGLKLFLYRRPNV
ncbi:hypothetical protein GCM10027277_25600 [Pseudoduganella ginsengisoli]